MGDINLKETLNDLSYYAILNKEYDFQGNRGYDKSLLRKEKEKLLQVNDDIIFYLSTIVEYGAYDDLTKTFTSKSGRLLTEQKQKYALDALREVQNRIEIVKSAFPLEELRNAKVVYESLFPSAS